MVTKITIKKGSKGHLFLQEMKKRKQERKEEMLKRMPPKEIMEYVNKHTADTFNLNKGKLDKESFKLGMLAMWLHLIKK
jgi:hypothetical protein